MTRGRRVASFLWLQSKVRENESRQMLLSLATTLQRPASERGQVDEQVLGLTGIYHNLLRKWVEL